MCATPLYNKISIVVGYLDSSQGCNETESMMKNYLQNFVLAWVLLIARALWLEHVVHRSFEGGHNSSRSNSRTEVLADPCMFVLEDLAWNGRSSEQLHV